MDMSSIKKFAAQKGVKNPSNEKVELIRQIQQAEGYSSCFADGRASCNQDLCAWRSDCMKPAKDGGKSRGKKLPAK